MKFLVSMWTYVHTLLNPPKKETLSTMTITQPTVLIRPRRASENKRRTQVQLPIDLFNSAFLAGVTTLVNRWGDRRKIVLAHARGHLNTVKVEIPELSYIADPAIRLTRKENGDVLYEAFSGDSITGSSILDTLRLGMSTRQTRVTLPRQRERATWYRQVA